MHDIKRAILLAAISTALVAGCGADGGGDSQADGLAGIVDSRIVPYLHAADSAMAEEMSPDEPFYENNYCRGLVAVATMPFHILELAPPDTSFGAASSGLTWTEYSRMSLSDSATLTETVGRAQNMCIEADGDPVFAFELIMGGG